MIKELRKVRAELDDAKREVDEASGANGRICVTLEETRTALKRTHDDRALAWSRTALLEQRLMDQDVAVVELAEQRDAAVASVEAMQVEDLEAGFAS